eukprot:6529107-Lingulodinium_polyedra.AAC.1
MLSPRSSRTKATGSRSATPRRQCWPCARPLTPRSAACMSTWGTPPCPTWSECCARPERTRKCWRRH